MFGYELTGYRRKDGRVGIRNFVVVMAAADNVNPLARRLAEEVSGIVCLEANYGRGQLGDDLELTLRTMTGLAAHPNVFGSLIVSFEPESALRIAERVEKMGRGTHTISLLEEGGLAATVQSGRGILDRLLEDSQKSVRTPFHVGELLIGLECGGSDTSSGVVANPAIGMISDDIVQVGGTTIFSEPVECIGCEQLLAIRARSESVGAEIIASIEKYKRIALDQGVDLTGINPTADNIAGGLSSIEEKSLGSISKSGTAEIQGVLRYGERPYGPGLWFMDAPAAGAENLTALAAAGCQVVLFSTGSANPLGHPISPTLKISANMETARRMREHIDVDLSLGLSGELGLDGCAQGIIDFLGEVIAGRRVKAEELGYLENTISRIGESV